MEPLALSLQGLGAFDFCGAESLDLLRIDVIWNLDDKRCSLELGAKSAAIILPDAVRAAPSRACATAPSSASGHMQQHGGPLPRLNLVKLG
jgi:hypothetical protein